MVEERGHAQTIVRQIVANLSMAFPEAELSRQYGYIFPPECQNDIGFSLKLECAEAVAYRPRRVVTFG